MQRNIRRGIENVAPVTSSATSTCGDPNAPAIPALPGGVRPTDEQLAALDAGLPEQPDHVAGILTGLAEDDAGWAASARSIGPTPSRPCAASPAVSVPQYRTRPARRRRCARPQWHPGRAARVMVGATLYRLGW